MNGDKMKIKEMLKKACVKFERAVYPVAFIHIADLLTPVNGKITGSQMVIVSRILDIENYDKGDESFMWQERLTTLGGGG